MMANFPRREADIKALAQNMIAGLHNNPDFPAPPVNGNELKQLLDEFNALEDVQLAAQAAAQQATEAKQAKLDQLTAAMKKDLHYAEDAVDGNDAKLAALGWGGKAAPTALQAPGQPRSLEAAKEGPGWLFLDWKKATDGGKTAFYRIERRELPGGTWAMVGTALEIEVTLTNQERGKEYEYRVIAVNKAGESGPSNTVTAVL
jgi:hypothetical protein